MRWLNLSQASADSESPSQHKAEQTNKKPQEKENRERKSDFTTATVNN